MHADELEAGHPQLWEALSPFTKDYWFTRKRRIRESLAYALGEAERQLGKWREKQPGNTSHSREAATRQCKGLAVLIDELNGVFRDLRLSRKYRSIDDAWSAS